MPIQQHKAAAPVCTAYIEPKVKPWQYYRSADNARVFHILDINTVDFGHTGHVMYKEWGKDQVKHVPLATFIQQIENGQLKQFNPSPLQYIFIDNLKKQD